ncbi:predicted protein [Nematostella vectensis]|uniref:Sphingomyelin phosphodiesterase 4 n=1 Tax=Nematostella vectensis TaxID=45351 RepID=A7SAI1_NEMVE|nr:predicted protein [Nematostella vectensis]|eukprot:XP_001631377.1 predicted protein [Nematostella vectensis]
MESFSKRVQASLQKPLNQKCEEISRLIDDSSIKELHNFFPDLLGSVFGYDGKPDWGLRTILPNHREFEVLRLFLSPHGPLFRLLDKLQVDGHLKYEFYVRLLPAFDSNWLNGAECPYMVILEDYLNYFLPAKGPLVTSLFSSSSSTNLPRTNAWQTSNPYLQQSPMTNTQFAGLLKTSSTQITPPGKAHTGYGHTSRETTQSEKFLQILTEFWLNQNTLDGVTSNVLSHGQQYFLPGIDLVRVVRMLIKQVHCFVYSSGIYPLTQLITSQDDEFKRSLIPQMLQKKLYCFLRHCFAHWPLDPSFRVVIEAWLSYIQPWRYANQVGPTRGDQQGGEPFSPEWTVFVHENLLFYTSLLREFVLRALKLDLFSVKDAFVLLRGTKVLSQSSLLDVIESDEKLLLIPSGGGRGTLRGSSSSIGVSLVSSLRAHIAELEGPSYSYTPVLQQPGLIKIGELRHLVQSVLTEVLRQQSGGYGNGQTPTNQGGVGGWMKHIFSGDFLNDGAVARSEQDKLVSHLRQASDNLAAIISMGGDVTDAEDVTIPWSHATPPSGRPLSRVPMTPNMPECKETDWGLVLTERGKYQVIMGMRRPEVFYAGDPELQPIRSYENAALVRALYALSARLNTKLGDTLQNVYNHPGLLGNLACTVSPAVKTSPTRSALGASPITSPRRGHRPRLSLRYLASYRTMFYLFLLYIVCWLLNIGSLGTFLVFVFVLLGSVIAHVGPAYERRQTQRKSL